MRTNTAVSHWNHRKSKQSAIPDTDEGEFEAEQIVDKRISLCGRRVHYLVKWKGYPMSENTWEPPSNLVNCKELIREYERQHANETSYRVTTTRKRNRRSSKNQSPIAHPIKREPEPSQDDKLTQIMTPTSFGIQEEGDDSEDKQKEEESAQNISISEGNEVGIDKSKTTVDEMDDERKKYERLSLVSAIIQMNNQTDGEIAYEAEFRDGEREWLCYKDVHEYLKDQLIDFYERTLDIHI